MRLTRTLFFYRFAQYLSLPFVILYFAFRLLVSRDYRPCFRERLGFLPESFKRTESGSIWLHAVSVGEVVSVVPLLKALRTRWPDAPLFLSVGTVNGRKVASQRTVHLVDGLFYAPLDMASRVRRTLYTIKPSLVIVLETEIWPNLFAEVVASGAALVLANARISDRTWKTYYRLRKWFEPVLQLSCRVFVQSAVDLDRYGLLGVPADKLASVGNLKFDAATPTDAKLGLQTWDADTVWIAASTVGGKEPGRLDDYAVDEEDVVIECFQQLRGEFPGLLLILAPRQPTRFEDVARKLTRAGVSFTRRSELHTQMDLPPLKLPGVLLLDSMGELSGIYSLADVVFVGGSLAPRGGHNIIEPASSGKAIVVGPHMENFAAIVEQFLTAGALRQVTSATELSAAIRQLLSHPAERKTLGSNAKLLVAKETGAATRIADELGAVYLTLPARAHRNIISRLTFEALALLWTRGGAAKRRNGMAIAKSRQQLPVPVISIGGITIGGSGKTPFCDYLANEFRMQGYAPAILTRGYRRRSPARIAAFAPGTVVSPALTGDEAQIFLRSGHATVVIGADRYQSAQAILPHIPPSAIFLMDDGFQHARMPRDYDVVLIDALDPFGGFAVVPVGRLREPLSELRRANAFVVVRADDTNRFQAIRQALQRYNPTAPVFNSQLKVCGWKTLAREDVAISSKRTVAAFCGLGNPNSFWNTLGDLGLNIKFRWAFPDHHQYRPTDIQRLLQRARDSGAELLVTTEKDMINLPSETIKMLRGFELAWLRIELRLTTPEAFFAHLNSALR